MRGVRAEVNDCLSIAQHHGAPLVAFPACELAGVISGDVYGPKVTPVDVATIGIEENRFSIRRERPLLNFAAARRKQARGSAFSGKRIEMLPAVVLGSDQQTAVGCPANNTAASVASHVRVRPLRRATAVPNFARAARRRVRHPNRPRVRLIGLKKIANRRVAWLSGTPDKGNTLTVRRPDRVAVGIDAGSNEMHGLCRHVVNTDEAMIGTGGNEDQLRTVGRPFFRMILAAHNQLLGLFATIQRSDPDLPIADIS